MTNQKAAIISKLSGGLIVSCQALEDEPLHSSYIMGRMALAAAQGGASGIRANSVADIEAIKATVDVPIIGIIKANYPDSDVYITPTENEVSALIKVGAEIIALDATARLRPGAESLESFFAPLRLRYPDQLFMADCSTVAEAVRAVQLGFDIVSTTLAGYTPYTEGRTLPDTAMIKALADQQVGPIIGEGGIWTPEQLQSVLGAGALAAVIGTAITRPREITRRFVRALPEKS
ncbi:N-acetylmannosamine-6-phosphate 2-epimerase [Oscillospiraceae bacterium HV4-5-C5C]|nr:N-acetylmannosamine-6-phosphate 2-epimerase [Oscillospiraceae bacterium HV4-5-C5C]